ncbi:2-Ketovalerate ferredoxin oxidoreductase subunit [Elusimicrobium minutum Pei191]|uniref:2-Ketovalerate ferredoxin oxidoreductase subunit n=1 Tax=Elusimicrobium minutum (strain Pei191) TaxID=445932 RepID=B2KES9_ELUMP|nr:thiamine pyrophosphate-dependent enzyme [Elusimicrobium minutum]ACC99025.1 2-Ketovalerate ferredoxin oxidoreductase subunit [Elusimicrobium minutum Pei191]
MEKITKRPESLTDVPFHYCPGCGHGVVHRLIAETMDELKIRERTIGVAPVGCAVFADSYFNCDMIQGAHGRGPAIATGIKRAKPESIVFSYQGDGDLASIGMAEIVHTAIRSENITVIFINNAIYGMTGGQMAPTTLVGQPATTAPKGRDAALQGYPINICEMFSQIKGSKYLERVAVDTPQNVMKAKKAVKKAFENQVNGVGFSLVEVLSQCPTNWGVDPVKSLEFVQKQMMEQYPLGVFKDEGGK